MIIGARYGIYVALHPIGAVQPRFYCSKDQIGSGSLGYRGVVDHQNGIAAADTANCQTLVSLTLTAFISCLPLTTRGRTTWRPNRRMHEGNYGQRGGCENRSHENDL